VVFPLYFLNTNCRSFKIPKKSPKTSQIWGGRFSDSPDEIMKSINASIDFDRKLFAEDILASKAHATMLGDQEIISTEILKAILKGLDQISHEIREGRFEFKKDLEDIHMNIEMRLHELIGSAAGFLHIARSRNDQVAVDLKLWVRSSLDSMDLAIRSFQKALIETAEGHIDTAMPGFTHMQLAQPVTLGHHLLAYVEMMGRDRGRISDCRKRLNENPLGAAALAGTSFPIDRMMTSRALGFDRPASNSIDAVSDRDFAIEYLSIASIIAVHLSRLGEEYVFWSSSQFGYARIGDSFSTGSSIMPQKRNPDAAELVRAKAGRVIGALSGLLIVMKGLPLTYGKDMQEDKEPIFQTHDTVMLSLAAMTGMLGKTTFDKNRMAEDAENGFSTATDLADWLVRFCEIPFREAHHIAGKIVKLAEENSVKLAELSLDQLRSIEPRIDERIFEVLSVENSLKSRTSFGGTAPKNVKKAILKAKKRFLD